MLDEGDRRKLLLEYASFVLKQIQGEDRKMAEGDLMRMQEIREEAGLDHLAMLQEIKIFTSGTVSR